MDAKKCDRCGAFYERYARKVEPSDSAKIKKLLNLKRNGLMITQDIGYCSENIDLCPECFEELLQWIDNKQLIGKLSRDFRKIITRYAKYKSKGKEK